MGLVSVNLSLSTLCGGNCVFCPPDRGERIGLKVMPFSYAKRIIDEVASSEFRRIHPVQKFEIGENGDALLNPEAINILRYLRLTNPDVFVRMTINFQNLTRDRSSVILGERLVAQIVCNIDGHDAASYYRVKRLNLDAVGSNILDFLKLREELGAKTSLVMASITFADYVKRIRENLGLLPSKLRGEDPIDIPDDFAEVQKNWSKHLDPKRDTIFRSGIVGWAERARMSAREIDYKSYSCPNLKRVKEECFIAPDGTWYACCLDSKNELTLGNAVQETISRIYQSERRLGLIRLLENNEYGLIGGPCRTVNCCQWL